MTGYLTAAAAAPLAHLGYMNHRRGVPVADRGPARHPHSPAGDQREKAVGCLRCTAGTWNICALCNLHCTHEAADRQADEQRAAG